MQYRSAEVLKFVKNFLNTKKSYIFAPVFV